jgi:hypothetical protein
MPVVAQEEETREDERKEDEDEAVAIEEHRCPVPSFRPPSSGRARAPTVPIDEGPS